MIVPVLVTGAPGTVGTPLVLSLLADGVPVRVAAHTPARAASLLDAGAEVVRFDMTDPSTFGAFDGVRRLFLLRPPAIADVDGVIAPVIAAAARFGMAGALTDDVQRLTGHPPIDFADFAIARRSVWEVEPVGDAQASGTREAEIPGIGYS